MLQLHKRCHSSMHMNRDVESAARGFEGDVPRALDWFQRNIMFANSTIFQVIFFWLKIAPRAPLGSWKQSN